MLADVRLRGQQINQQELLSAAASDPVLDVYTHHIENVPAGPWSDHQDKLMETFDQGIVLVLNSLGVEVSTRSIMLNYLRTNEFPESKRTEVEMRLGDLVSKGLLVQKEDGKYSGLWEFIPFPEPVLVEKEKPKERRKKTVEDEQDTPTDPDRLGTLDLPTDPESRKTAIATRDYVLGKGGITNIVDMNMTDYTSLYTGCRIAMNDRGYLADGCSDRLELVVKIMTQRKEEDKPSTFLREAPLWHIQANCKGVDPDLFFPERGASTREAKEVCRGCVIREDCLDFALANGEKFGIWGGMSERERRRLRRSRALAKRDKSISEEAQETTVG